MKFKRAVFCYLLSRFDARLHSWLMLVRESRKVAGLLSAPGNGREQLADWAVDMLLGKADMDLIIKILVGDEYFDKNKRDIARLERETKKSVMTLWDTDPIFEKYPHLKTLARNKEFEKKWAKMNQKTK